MTGTKETQCC